MPIDEIEIHPYLKLGQIYNSKKLILGSFPVFECTNPDTITKQKIRADNGSFQYFYGSSKSSFWTLYSKYIDKSINLNRTSISESLFKNKISISDTIISCKRKMRSSADNDLIQKTWNKTDLLNLIQNGTTKILCTSKGVMIDLEKRIISSSINSIGKCDKKLSEAFHIEFIKKLNGYYENINNPISRVFIINDIKIEVLSIPSPGSPQRQLKRFGFNQNDWRKYADDYFEKAFNWFNA